MRAPIQVVVIPFRMVGGADPEYAVFRRSDDGNWQPIAGGAEDHESPARAARREAHEEAGLPLGTRLYQLQSMDTVAVTHFRARGAWPSDLYVVPQLTFGVNASGLEITTSQEHTEHAWVGYAEAAARLAYQSNQAALWELHERLKRSDLPPPC